jgi:LCP family protein required for cell wall assembly
MSNHNTKSDNLVDISSSTQVIKLYNKKGRAKRILCVILSVILLLSGSGMIYYYSVLNSMNFLSIDDNQDTSNEVDSTLSTVAELEGDDTNLSLSDGELLQNSKVLNVMLFGEDNSQGDTYGRSDTMIMMSIDNVHKKLKLTSFQRDTYVYIPGYGHNKLNAAYTQGGAKLTIQTIEANFGIKVDRYAVVDFDSFKKIIDTLGGIDIELTQDEIDYINYQMYKNNQSSEYTTITDSPGVVHLDGQEALWYARDRGLSKGEDGNEIGIDGDDWDRTSRQRNLLQTLFNDMKSADLTQIISIVSAVGPLVTTNLKKDEITALVSHSLKYLSYDVEQYYVPEEGLWYYDDKTVIDGEITSTIKISDLDAQRVALATFIFEDLFSTSTTTTN